MGKKASTQFLDASLDHIKNNCNLMVSCDAEPADYAAAVGANKLADVAMSSGDFSKSSSGDDRRLTVATKNSVQVDTTGTITHRALVDTSSSELIFVTTVTPVAVTASGSVNMNSFYIDNKAPT